MKVGDRVGRWTIIGEPSGSRVPTRCECGTVRDTLVWNLKSGQTFGCHPCSQKGKRAAAIARWRVEMPIGTRIGRWVTVTERGPKSVECVCDCGTRAVVLINNLSSGATHGCIHCAPRTGALRHGQSKTDVYNIWASMRRRCNDETSHGYHRYGGRGIRVCDEWNAVPGGFEAFAAHIGPRPSKAHSVDRIDNNGDYAPGNVRWATLRTQLRNTCRNNLLQVGGELLTLQEAGDRVGISREAIRVRLLLGWTHAEAATLPRGQVPARLQREREAKRAERAATRKRERERTRSEKLSIAAVATGLGLSREAVHSRLRRGWPLDLALTAGRYVHLSRIQHANTLGRIAAGGE